MSRFAGPTDLLTSAPFEDRAAFLARLRRAVTWVNNRQAPALLTMCTNQKERARDVIRLDGARTKW